MVIRDGQQTQAVERYRTPNSHRLILVAERIWLEEGDLALNVRRLLKEAKVTGRDLYLTFGSRADLLEHVARELADHVSAWSVRSGSEYVAVSLQRPAAWRALLLGHGPLGHPGEPGSLSAVRARIRSVVGSDVELAKLDGIVAAVIAGHLEAPPLDPLPTPVLATEGSNCGR